jgi:hypothetical protein
LLSAAPAAQRAHAEAWVRSREQLRPRRSVVRRILHASGLVLGLGFLAWIPMQFGPQKSSAQPVGAGERPRLLGTIAGVRYLVEVRASDRGPLYTVRLRQGGRVLARDLAADEVYRAVPDLDVSTLHVGPDGGGDLGRPLMMVHPTDEP